MGSPRTVKAQSRRAAAASVAITSLDAVEATRVAAAGGITLTSTGAAATGTDLAGGDIAVTGDAGAGLTRFSGGMVTVDGGVGAASAADGAAVSLDARAGAGGLLLRNLTLGALEAEAFGGIVAQALRQTDGAGAASLLARSGDVELGRIAAAGDLLAEAEFGAVLSGDTGQFLSPGAAVTVTAPVGGTVGGDVATLIGAGAPDARIQAVAPGGTDVALASPAITGWLQVTGDLLLVADAAVTLGPPDAATDSFVAGRIMVEANQNLADVALAIGGDLVFDAFAAAAPSGAALGGFAADVAGAFRVRSGAAGGAAGGISQAAAFRVGGEASFVTGVHADATLDPAQLRDISLGVAGAGLTGNEFGGTVSVLGADVLLDATGTLQLEDALALDDGGGTGAMEIQTDGALLLRRAEAAQSLSVTGASVEAADLIGGALALTATAGGLTLDRAAAAADLEAVSTAETSVDQLSAGADMRLRAGTELRLGALAVGGALAAEADAGAIRIKPSAGAAAIAGASFAGTAADEITLSTGLRPGQAIPAAAFHLDVIGGAAFLAAGDVALPAAVLGNNFAGGLAAAAGGNMYLAAAGPLTFGIDADLSGAAEAADMPAFASGAVVANAVSVAGSARVDAGGALLQTAGAPVSVASASATSPQVS